MTEPSEAIDFSKIDVPNPSKASMSPVIYEKGMSEESALNRLLYRFNHAELNLEKRKQILREGNIAQLEGEIFVELSIVQDLIDICREFASLSYVSISQLRNAMLGIANLALASKNFQQEQGEAPPPNGAVEPTGTPAQP